MKHRFDGDQNRRLLVDTLMTHKIVVGNTALAEEIARLGELADVTEGTVLIEQGADDNDVYLILTGSFAVIVNGKRLGTRTANDHVGEMAAIQQTQRRSASVIADEPSVVLKLTEAQVADLGTRYPDIYKGFAKELARRLLQRNFFVTSRREKIRVFMICSVEALSIARAVQESFDHDPFQVTVWPDGVFRASQYPLDALESELDQSDFAIAVVQPDDVTQTRDVVALTPRDNVIFELGFFMGRLGRARSLLLEPRGEEVRLPSDLKGITTISYKYDPSAIAAAMGPACNRIRNIINELGPNN